MFQFADLIYDSLITGAMTTVDSLVHRSNVLARP